MVKWFSYLSLSLSLSIYIYMYIYIYVPFQILFHSRLLQHVEYSSLCDTKGLCYLSVFYIVVCIWGFSGGSDGKEFACQEGNPGLIPGLGRCPGGGHGNPPQYSCLKNPHGWRSLAGYSPWGCKDWATKHNTTHHHHLWLRWRCAQTFVHNSPLKPICESGNKNCLLCMVGVPWWPSG